MAKYESRLHVKYNEEIAPALMKELGLSNVNEIPKLEKIVINMGVGEAAQNSKLIEAATKDLEIITGRKALVIKAKKSEAGFKLREGQAIGAKVTLRREAMYDFIDRLVSVVLPRVRDFEGISANAFDGRGNYSLGLEDQLVFPEIEYDKVEKVRGMDIIVVTTAKTDEEAKELLRLLGMPFSA